MQIFESISLSSKQHFSQIPQPLIFSARCRTYLDEKFNFYNAFKNFSSEKNQQTVDFWLEFRTDQD